MNRTLRAGQAFNPYRMFVGLFIPEGLARCNWLNAGAKLAWGRLARYAGEDGRCHPTMHALGAEIGVGERQVQKYLVELEKAKLIRRVTRFHKSAQTSNTFAFLWHDLFERGANDGSREGVNNDSPRGTNCSSPKESQIEESHFEESQRCDLDYPPTNRKNRDSRLEGVAQRGRSLCQYPRLTATLADYMMEPDDKERIYPSNRVVVDIVDAAQGASEEEIIQCLRYLYGERRLHPGTKHGPRHFSWFKTVVADYFLQKRDREFVINPAGSPLGQGSSSNGLSADEFDAMTGALE